MWLFLSVWTFNFICTLTALLMVWVYEIAAPVSWVLVVPSLAFDIWRMATPKQIRQRNERAAFATEREPDAFGELRR